MMIDMEQVQEVYRAAVFPTPDQVQEELRRCKVPQLDQKDVTEEYLRLQNKYRFLFGLYFVTVSELYKLDEKLMQREYLPAEEEEKDFYQKYDLCRLNYFYVRSWTHVERLSEDEKEVLDACLRKADQEAELKLGFEMIEQTFRKVMAVCPERGEEQFELYESIHGEGWVKGEDIVIAMKTSPRYDENDRIVDWDEEERMQKELIGVATQLEEILSENFSVSVKTLVYR